MVLKQKSLLYYKTESDAHSGNENPQGAVALDGASVAALLDNNEFSSSHSGQRRGMLEQGSLWRSGNAVLRSSMCSS
jgi:hypothetical protein